MGYGLDLVRAFDAASYNQLAAEARLSSLPLFGRPGALGLIIGNTRALWPRFLEAYRQSEVLQASPHPLDAYVQEAVTACAGVIPCDTHLGFAHDRGERLVCMLRLAEASGLARVGPAHLAVHPHHGLWFGLRAVIVANMDPPAARAPERHPCPGCEAPCVRALEAALAQATAETPDVEANRSRWVAVRDACPVGRPSRYGDDQIRYHYTKDVTVLRRSKTVR